LCSVDKAQRYFAGVLDHLGFTLEQMVSVLEEEEEEVNFGLSGANQECVLLNLVRED